MEASECINILWPLFQSLNQPSKYHFTMHQNWSFESSIQTFQLAVQLEILECRFQILAYRFGFQIRLKDLKGSAAKAVAYNFLFLLAVLASDHRKFDAVTTRRPNPGSERQVSGHSGPEVTPQKMAKKQHILLFLHILN